MGTKGGVGMIRVVIAEDQMMVADAMKQLLELDGTMHVIEIATNGFAAWQSVQQHQPDIAILDIEMPEMNGLEVLHRIREHHLETLVIILTTFKRPGYFEKAVANDVDAFLLKEQSIEDLRAAIHRALSGEKTYSASLMTHVFRKSNPLTHREQMILIEIGKGLSHKSIATKLFLSEGTVRNYASVMIEKLEAENRFDAWKKAKEAGWI